MPREIGRVGGKVAESGSAAGIGLCHGWTSVPAPRSRTRSFFRRRRPRAGRACGWRGWTKTVVQLVRFWPVIQNMVVGELRVRYQRSILGFVWSLLNPLLDDGDSVVGLLVAQRMSRTIPSSCSPAWFRGAS